MRISIHDGRFFLDSRRLFICSGEVHYFQLPKRLWKTHLEALKEANCNTVSFYVPWCWHEYEEGRFDFSGHSDERRDLEGFLRLCKELGLYAIARVGPQGLAESSALGIPLWLVNNYPDVLACNDSVPLLASSKSSTFRKYVSKWLKQILPIVNANAIDRDGPIILLQVCNEVGCFHWLTGVGDMSEDARISFRSYLRKKYIKISRVESAYRARVGAFERIDPPVGDIRHEGHFRRYLDWQAFHRNIYLDYLDFLLKALRRSNVHVPAYHNVAGWYMGRAYDYPVNITFYKDVYKRVGNNIFFAHDHIPEFLNGRNFHDGFICQNLLSARQPDAPSFVAELQCGTREYTIHSSPAETEQFYKVLLAQGISGMNFYMFSQGTNPDGPDWEGGTFYWGTPLNADGSKNPIFNVVQRIGKYAQKFHEEISDASLESEIAVNFYSPYYETEFLQPIFGKSRIFSRKGRLTHDIRLARERYFFDGWLKVLQFLNRGYSFIDVNKETDPGKFKTLVVFSLDFMDRRTQRKIVDYIKSGGNAILYPMAPVKDLRFETDITLLDTLGIRQKGVRRNATVKAGSLRIGQVGPVSIYTSDNADVIATTETGEWCALQKRFGRGRVTLVGFGLPAFTEGHIPFYQQILGSPSDRQIELDNPQIQFSHRRGRDYSVLFFFNPTGTTQGANLQVNLKGLKSSLRKIVVPPAGLILLLNFPLKTGDLVHRILYTNSEITGYGSGPNQFFLDYFCHEEKEIETILKLDAAVDSIHLQGVEVPYSDSDEGVSFRCLASRGENRIVLRLKQDLSTLAA